MVTSSSPKASPDVSGTVIAFSDLRGPPQCDQQLLKLRLEDSQHGSYPCRNPDTRAERRVLRRIGNFLHPEGRLLCWVRDYHSQSAGARLRSGRVAKRIGRACSRLLRVSALAPQGMWLFGLRHRFVLCLKMLNHEQIQRSSYSFCCRARWGACTH